MVTMQLLCKGTTCLSTSSMWPISRLRSAVSNSVAKKLTTFNINCTSKLSSEPFPLLLENTEQLLPKTRCGGELDKIPVLYQMRPLWGWGVSLVRADLYHDRWNMAHNGSRLCIGHIWAYLLPTVLRSAYLTRQETYTSYTTTFTLQFCGGCNSPGRKDLFNWGYNVHLSWEIFAQFSFAFF